MAFSLKESILGKKVTIEEAKEKIEDIETEEESEASEVEGSEEENGEGKETEEEGSEEVVETPREELIDEIQDALTDLTDDELDVVLDAIYAIILADEESEEKEEGSEENMEESLITHMTSKDRTTMRMKRRTPKWKRKAKIRYLKNKKCPAGTTWSSATKTCTHINIDMSRLEKIIAKMRIK